MKLVSKTIIRGSLTMLGAIIGAGVFAIPYAFKTMGVVAGSVVFWFIVAVLLATHVLYAEVILSDAVFRKTRLFRQVRHVLGEWPGYLAFLTHPFSLIGACLAYLMIGGSFLATLSRTVGLLDNPMAWQLVFWLGGAIAVYFGVKTVSRIQSSMGWVLVSLLLLSIVLMLPAGDFALAATSHWESVLPIVGVLVFALSGFQIIPEIVEVSGRIRKRTMSAIVIGSLLAAALEWLFGVSAYLAVGSSLSAGTADLSRAFPSALAWLIPTVGFVSVATAFVSMAEELKSVFQFDFHFPESIGWFLALGAPLAMLVFVQKDFTQTIGFVGSVFGSLNGMLICLMAFALIRQGKMLQRSLLRFAPIVCLGVFLFTFAWRILPL